MFHTSTWLNQDIQAAWYNLCLIRFLTLPVPQKLQNIKIIETSDFSLSPPLHTPPPLSLSLPTARSFQFFMPIVPKLKRPLCGRQGIGLYEPISINLVYERTRSFQDPRFFLTTFHTKILSISLTFIDRFSLLRIRRYILRKTKESRVQLSEGNFLYQIKVICVLPVPTPL